MPLLSSKDLGAIPPRILRFRLRLMRYSFSICHVLGKYLYSADVLSRSLSLTTADDTDSTELETSAKLFIPTVVSNLCATSNRLKALTTAQSEDQTLQHVR